MSKTGWCSEGRKLQLFVVSSFGNFVPPVIVNSKSCFSSRLGKTGPAATAYYCSKDCGLMRNCSSSGFSISRTVSNHLTAIYSFLYWTNPQVIFHSELPQSYIAFYEFNARNKKTREPKGTTNGLNLINLICIPGN